MGLKYTEEFIVESNKKNVVFCLYKTDSEDKNRQINLPLRRIQQMFIDNRKKKKYEKSFVYGGATLIRKKFTECDPNKIYYLTNKACRVPVSQLLLISLQSLEEKQKEDLNAENQLYLITDTVFSKIEGKKCLEIMKAFGNKMSFKPILVTEVKNRNLECYEEYIKKEGKIFSFSEFAYIMEE